MVVINLAFNKYEHRPMSATQANDLMDRILTVFTYRKNIWDSANSYTNPHMNGIRQSITNINKLNDKRPQSKIDDVDMEEDPNLSNENTIRAVDGIAILNSILNVNDISKNFNGKASSIANLGDITIVEWKSQILKVITAYTNIVTHIYRKDNSSGSTVTNALATQIVNMRNTLIAVAHFTSGYYDNSPYKIDGQWDTSVMSTELSKPYMIYEFDTNHFGDTEIEAKLAQIDYINAVLADIKDKKIITYVKDFTEKYVIAKSGNNDVFQNITIAFDYYVLDYLVQILEFENTLFGYLVEYYQKIPSSDRTRDNQHAQYNTAPGMHSSCNTSCVGLCYGSCVGTCNGCGSCTSFCGVQCGATCTSTCQTTADNGTCKDGCATSCGVGCDVNCTKDCKSDCNAACVKSCSLVCAGKCSSECTSDCNTKCVSTCNTGCKTSCTGTCGENCIGSASSKNNVANNNPKPETVNTARNTNNIYPSKVTPSSGGPSSTISTYVGWVEGYAVPQVLHKNPDGSYSHTDGAGNTTNNVTLTKDSPYNNPYK